jgi:hypothetical protein
MALSILDGNQSATTLSTILSSGQHITAHTVVSLGTQAITDMRGAVSGSVVSISNLPSTQTIAGTVTVSKFDVDAFTGVIASDAGGDEPPNGVQLGYFDAGSGFRIVNEATPLPISGTVTIGSLPAISGTVTANVFGQNQTNFFQEPIPVDNYANTRANAENDLIVPVQITNDSGTLNASNPLPISGTVTATGLDISSGNQHPIPLVHWDEGVSDGRAVVVKVLDANGTNINFSAGVPISGTVTIGSALPAGTNRIGVVTIGGGTVTIGAGTAQIGTVTASNTNLNRLVQDGEFTDTFGVPIIYARVAGGALDYWQEVSQISGLPVKNQLTTGGDIVPFSVSGAVTANTFALQGTAVTTSDFTSTTASTVLANFNATREVLTIFNEGAGNLHICAGATCTTIAYQVRLSAGDYYEVPNHQTTITHSAVFATAGTARVCQVS